MLDLFTKIAEKFKALSRKDPTRDSVHRRKIQFETLEKRVLLSADLGVDFQNFQEAPDLKPDTVSTLVDRDGRFEESEILDASNPETESENSLLSEDARISESEDLSNVVDSETGANESTIKDNSEGDSESNDVLPAETQNTPESQENITDAIDEDQPLDPQNNDDNVFSSTNADVSPQAVYLESQHSIQELVIVDPSVPDYESLLEEFILRSSDADKVDHNYMDNDEADSGDTEVSHSEDVPDTHSPDDLALDSDPASTDTLSPTLERGVKATNDSRLEIVILDPEKDGLEQISEILSQYQRISAVHILSHGAMGMLRLGNSQIDKKKLVQKSSQIGTWKKAIKPGGDILLYGCNVAQGEAGIEFVENLSEMTGVDVAASTDDTGSRDLGGNWVLEYSTSVVESAGLFQGAGPDGYMNLLAPLQVTSVVNQDDTTDVTITANNADNTVAVSYDTDSDTVTIADGLDSITLIYDDGTDEIIVDTTPADTTTGTTTYSNLNALNINLGDGNDTFTLNGFDPNFIADLTIDGQGDNPFVSGSDTVIINGRLSISDSEFKVSAESISVNSGVNVNTGSGLVNLSAIAQDESQITDAGQVAAKTTSVCIEGSITTTGNITITSEVIRDVNVSSPSDVSVNSQSDAKVEVLDGAALNAAALTISARTGGEILTESTGVDFIENAKVSIRNATINVESLNLSAQSSTSYSARGRDAVNRISGDTKAYIDNSMVTAGVGGVTLSAIDTSGVAAESPEPAVDLDGLRLNHLNRQLILMA